MNNNLDWNATHNKAVLMDFLAIGAASEVLLVNRVHCCSFGVPTKPISPRVYTDSSMIRASQPQTPIHRVPQANPLKCVSSE